MKVLKAFLKCARCGVELPREKLIFKVQGRYTICPACVERLKPLWAWRRSLPQKAFCFRRRIYDDRVK